MTPEEFIKWRQSHGWTQAQAANLLGVALSSLKNWEGGRRMLRPSIRVAMEMLDHLDRPSEDGVDTRLAER